MTDTSAARLTEDEIEQLRQHHHPMPLMEPEGEVVCCAECTPDRYMLMGGLGIPAQYRYPCRAIRALDELVALRAEVEALRGDCVILQSQRDLYRDEAKDTRISLKVALHEVEALRGVVREAVEVLQGAASVWSDMYPSWLVYALLGPDAEATVPFNRVDMGPSYERVAALVAAAQGGEASE